MKRIFDVIVAGGLLIVASPFFVLISLLILIKMGRPIFFRQTRPGLHGKPFTVMKFRTLTNEKDAKGNLLEDHERATKFGVFLRSASLDELPQLMNVLRGELSLVGPRPLLMEYLPLYSDLQRKRHDVLPGITGWAQVNGRNALTWEEKFKYDLEYVAKQSFLFDLKILFITAKKVLKKEGVSNKEHFSMETFTGQREEANHYFDRQTY